MTTLDVVIPTYNRCAQLANALRSLTEAAVPEELDVTIIVVDNNCTDDTAAFVQQMRPAGPVRLRYVKEEKQGLSNARNGGIAAGSGELIGFIDDDEQIDSSWYKVVEREFRATCVKFIGGPYKPVWGAVAPNWLPSAYPAVIGIVPAGEYRDCDKTFPGILMGGNAVIRRTVFQQIGGYAPALGRTNKGLLSAEDDEFYRRLLRNGILGRNVPDLVIHHFIPPERLTKKYHRRWCFWHAVSQAVLDRTDPRQVAYFAGVPRYLIGDVVRGLYQMPLNLITGKPGAAFANELSFWDLTGFFYGKHWFSTGS